VLGQFSQRSENFLGNSFFEDSGRNNLCGDLLNRLACGRLDRFEIKQG
jgi:hypothetical protein